MSDSPGAKVGGFGGGLDAMNRAAALTALAFTGTLVLSLEGFPVEATRGVPQPAVSIAHANHSGEVVEMFGASLFEQIIVTPRIKALGFILGATSFQIEVWNTFRSQDQTLTAINLTGSGGLVVVDTFGLPLIFAALDSAIYQATIPGAGDPQISEDVTFVFVSGVSGGTVHVTGSRITLISVAPDWGSGIEESIEYLTDVLKCYSDNEQRRSLRKDPRRALRYKALTLNARDAAGLESLLWGWQQNPFGVPWWPDSQPLLADIAQGVFVIPVATADRIFAPGGLICIWQDEFTFEALSIQSLTSSTVTTSSPTQFAWTAGPQTRVMPVLLGRVPASVDVARHSSEIDEVDLNFAGEAGQQAPNPSSSPTQYSGIDVLELAPNWESAPLKRGYARSLVITDPKIGKIGAVDKGGTPVVRQDFPWWLDTHPNITTFRAFIFRRFGQVRPFWVPTWDQDLVLAQSLASGDTQFNIQSEFYARFLFPTPARRYLAFIPVDGSAPIYRKVTAATDNGNGTELLTIDSAIGANFTPAQVMICFLTLCRLATDAVTIKWDSSEHAQALLSFQEVPRELPA